MKAFTLLELLVVLLLIALTSSILLPKIRPFNPSPSSLPDRLENFFSKARQRAYLRNENLLVIIDDKTRSFLLYNLPINEKNKILDKVYIPKKFEIKVSEVFEISSSPAILFFSSGASSGGEIEIINRETAQRWLIRIPQSAFYIEKKELL